MVPGTYLESLRVVAKKLWKIYFPVRFSRQAIKNRACNTITLQRLPLTSAISG